MDSLEQQAREWAQSTSDAPFMVKRFEFSAERYAERLAAFTRHILSQHPPAPVGKVLTDEDIEGRIGKEEYPIGCGIEENFGIIEARRIAFEDGLRYARDHGYLAPAPVNGLSVEQVMEAGERMNKVCQRIARQLVHGKVELSGSGEMDLFLSMCKQWESAKSALSQQAGEPVSDVEPVQLSRDYEALYEHLCNGGEALGRMWHTYPSGAKSIIEMNGAPVYYGGGIIDKDKCVAQWESIKLEWVAVKSSLPKNEGEPQQQQ